MPLQHSVGLPVGYMVEWVSRSGCKVLGLMFREVCGWFGGCFCGFCGVCMWFCGGVVCIEIKVKTGEVYLKIPLL